MPNEDDDAPPAIPEWEPSDLAKRMGAGHAAEHFPGLGLDALARAIQTAIDTGEVAEFFDRRLYWDRVNQIAVIVSPRDHDGGTAFPSDETYFEKWGNQP